VEIMTVVGIVGILCGIAIPALMHVKSKSEETLARNTIRQLYDAKEVYFLENGAGKTVTNVARLLQAGYASHSLDVATQHNIGPWNTTVLRAEFLKPGAPVKVSEVFTSGRVVRFGRILTYPDQK
jgi:Tfp pilus assembly protein PilE